jgi:uncharacterized membrane protein YhaH (DUF805 family)
MPILRLFLAATGAVRPRAFAIAVIVVYALGIAAHWLTAPAVLTRAGLWPFALAQILLLWSWFALHAKRLRDAGRGIGPAQGIAALYALAALLLMVVGAFFLDGAESGRSASAMPGSGAITAYLRLHIGDIVQGDPLAILVLVACATMLLAPAFSIWAGMLPSRASAATD